MCSRQVFGPKDEDDYDEIFNLDCVDPQYNIHNSSAFVNNRQIAPISTERRWSCADACETPKFDLIPSNENCQLSNNNLATNVRRSQYSDSAVGSSLLARNSTLSMHSSSKLFNDITYDDSEGRGSSLRMSMAPVRDRSNFPSTQDEMFSQAFGNSSMDSSSVATQPRLTNDSSLANHSFFSLMQRSMLKEHLQLPTSSFQLSVASQEHEIKTSGETFSSIFKTPTIGEGARYYNLNPVSQSQEISAVTSQDLRTGSIEDSYRQVMENQHSSQSQCAAADGIFTGCSIEDSYRRVMEKRHDEQPQRQNVILSSQNQNSKFIDVSSLPRSVVDLYQQIKSTQLSDWSFVYALSAQVCQGFMPMNFNVTLKISLLLSIASIDSVSLAYFGQRSILSRRPLDATIRLK